MKALCFDLDGTLVDTWEGERLARLGILEQLYKHSDNAWELVSGFYDVTWAQFKESYMNMLDHGYGEMSIRAMHLSRVLDELMIDGDPDKLAELHWDIMLDNMQIYPDVNEVTSKLGNKYMLTLITNGASDLQREKLKRLGLMRRFEEVIVSGEFGHHKPSKTIFDEMIRRTNTELGKTAYIGDNYMNDMLGAHEAGWRTIWVNRVDDVPSSIQPDWTISELTELLGLF